MLTAITSALRGRLGPAGTPVNCTTDSTGFARSLATPVAAGRRPAGADEILRIAFLCAPLLLPICSSSAQMILAPGEIIIASRGWGSVFGPLQAPGKASALISGRDLSTIAVVTRGVGPSLIADNGNLSILAVSQNKLIASSSSVLGRFDVNLSTGDRTLLPGTDGPLWTGSGEMLRIDDDVMLAVADDFAAGMTGDGKIIRYRFSTGESILVSGVARGDGVVMHRPRSLTRLDTDSIAVMESNLGSNRLPGSILYRVDIVTGNRQVISTIAPGATPRYTSTGGVRSASTSDIATRGTGPVFARANRGVVFVGGRLLVAGTVEGSNSGGFVEVDLMTGDRTLFAGTALDGSDVVTVPFGPGSDTYEPDAPTSLKSLNDRTIFFTETFNPNRAWRLDINNKRVNIVADLDPQILPDYRSSAKFSGLTIAPCEGTGAGFVIDQQPVGLSVCQHGTASFAVHGSSAGPFEYQWRKNAIPIDSVINSTAATPTLKIINASSADVGSFDCVVTNACGSLTSDPATLVVCAADFNCDNFINGDDFDAYVPAFVGGDQAADFDGNGFVNGDDFDAFVTAFEAGC